MSLTPSIGRKVLFNAVLASGVLAAIESIVPSEFILKGSGPFDATIAFVNDDGTVNLAVHDHDGNPHKAQNVTLWDGTGDRPDGTTPFAEWMPYQLQQAAADTAPAAAAPAAAQAGGAPAAT